MTDQTKFYSVKVYHARTNPDVYKPPETQRYLAAMLIVRATNPDAALETAWTATNSVSEHWVGADRPPTVLAMRASTRPEGAKHRSSMVGDYMTISYADADDKRVEAEYRVSHGGFTNTIEEREIS